MNASPRRARVSSLGLVSLLFAACGLGGDLGTSESGQRTELERGRRHGDRGGAGGDEHSCHGGEGGGGHGGPGDGHEHGGGPGGGRDHGWGSHPPRPDAGAPIDPNTPDASGGTPDAADVPEPCTVDAHCSGGARCLDGVCKLACTSDGQCAMAERCDLASGSCRPLTCGERTTEADCLAQAECQPVYAGIDCVDEAGGECTAGDIDCRCARFTFALCMDGDAR